MKGLYSYFILMKSDTERDEKPHVYRITRSSLEVNQRNRIQLSQWARNF